jgi:N4-gp56 family major capsid protein
MGTTTYGDITPRTAAFVVKDLLKRGMPYLCFEKFGQSKPLPANSTQTIIFRRYFLEKTFLIPSGNVMFNPKEYFNSQNNIGDDYSTAEGFMNPASRTLTEGTTPDATELDSQDYSASLTQYGDRVVITDVIMDTHEDNVLREAVDILGEQAAILIEKTRFNVLKACANIIYSDTADTQNSDVDKAFSLLMQRRITRFLKRQLAKPITSVVKSTPAYGTESIAPSFVCIVHPDMESDLRAVASFVPTEKYGSMTPYETEIGKIEDVRYIASTIVQPFYSVGAAIGSTGMVAADSTNLDVYPMIYLARDAYGIVAFKGANSLTPMVVNPHASDSDPLAQRGHVGWKGYSATIILNDFWMVCGRAAVSDLAS